MSGVLGADHDAPVRIARRVTTNTLASAVANIANKVLMFGYYIIVARHLGVERYGTLQAGIAFVTMFSVFTDLGLGNITAREIARDRTVAKRFVGNSLGVILVATGLVVVLILALVHLLRYPEPVRRVVYLLCVMLGCSAFVSYFCYVFIGYERMYFTAVTQMLQTGVLVGGAFVLARLVRSERVEYFALLYVGAAGIAAAFSALVTRRLAGSLGFRFDLPEWGRLISISLPVGIAVILVSIYYWNGHTLLQKWHQERAVGLFNAAFRLVVGACFAGQALSAALYPLLSRFFIEDRARLAGIFGSGLRFVAMLALPVAVLAIPLAGPVVALVYGEKYAESAEILRILAWWGAIAVFSSLLSNYLLAANRTKTVTLQCLLSLLANLVVNLLLIPRLAGTGAAIGLVTAELVGVIFLAVVLWRTAQVLTSRRLWFSFLRIAAALLPAFVLAWLLARLGTTVGNLAALTAAAAAYVLMLLATGALGRQERQMLKMTMKIGSGGGVQDGQSWTG